jgi:hypothetical protein
MNVEFLKDVALAVAQEQHLQTGVEAGLKPWPKSVTASP